MKILVIGSGGREHAMCWSLANSPEVEKIWAAPGNGGTAGEEKTENVPFEADAESEEGQAALAAFAAAEKIDLAVVGPEAPLAAGLADAFRKAGLAVVGPGKDAARLEASKAYSKAFMEKHGVRAAKSKSFTDPDNALSYVKAAKNWPLVVKADGLAAGKGVVIAENAEDARKCVEDFMKKGALGGAGKTVLIEEFLAGREVSVLAAVSVQPGKKGVIKPFLPARDHKRRFDGAEGPNTGGMGAICPVPDFSPAAQKDFVASILTPTLKGMEAEKMDYRGFIFFGLMVSPDDRCSLLEYNVRLGDPETQAVLPLMDSDFALLCRAIEDGSLGAFPVRWKNAASGGLLFACAPVMVADGYPGAYRKDDPIAFNDEALEGLGAKVFIAGAKRGPGGFMGSGLRSSGGRVLAVAATGETPEDARVKAYEAVRFVGFEGMDYRRDIGAEGLMPSGGENPPRG
jgi:phosphoribosylamine--glycine ligase